MKILGICATNAPKRPSTCMFLLEEALKAAEKLGAKTEAVRLAEYTVLPCNGCSVCMMFKPCPLLSRMEDQMGELTEKMAAADAFIFSYPTYAMLPASILFNFIDRLAPSEDMISQYKIYNLDQVPWVKGRHFRHKKVGIIATAAGTGMDYTAGILTPFFMAVRATVVASAGVSMMEYDQGPHVRATPIAKDIKGAEFAISMARSVGERVVTGDISYDETHRYVQTEESVLEMAKNRGMTDEQLEHWFAGRMGLNTAVADEDETAPPGMRREPVWSEDARIILDTQIPAFIRKTAKKKMEQYALQNDISVITPELMLEVKKKFGM